MACAFSFRVLLKDEKNDIIKMQPFCILKSIIYEWQNFQGGITMKKLVSTFIAFAMIFASSIPVLSSDAESEAMQRVLLDVKERIGSTDEYSEFYSNVSANGGHSTYSFSWSGDDKNLSISANSDGIVTWYRYYESQKDTVPYKHKPSINKMKSVQAMEKVKPLIRNLNPDIADNIRIISNTPSESLMNNSFTFEIQRTENGIDVVGDNGYITVNSTASAIESFRLNYTSGLSFESSADVIDTDSAKTSFKDKLGLKLQYVCEDQKGVLEYVPAQSNAYISAVSGEKICPVSPVYHLYKNEAAMDAVMSAGSGSSYRQLSEAELGNSALLETLISKSDGEKLLRSNPVLSISDNMNLSYFNTMYYTDAEAYYYTYEFTNETENASATINAGNGALKSYSYYNGKHENVTEDKTDLAVSMVEKLAPEHYKSDNSLAYRFDKAQNGNYTFARYANGIECVSNSITLSLNADGEISRYYINHSDVEFESPEGILTESEACNRLFDLCGYKLYYYPSCSSDNATFVDTALLVYDFESDYLTLDAKKGIIKDYGNTNPAVGNYTDISGHYAENIIRTLADFGIGFEENEFRPDDLITQQDYVVLITSALIGNEGIVLAKTSGNYSNYLDRAVSQRIIGDDEKNPEANVSREQAAVYMIRALDLDEVASLEGIYVSEFSDVKEHIGHISILSAMGVVNGYAGTFNPNQMLTRADAMIMLYNYLSR